MTGTSVSFFDLGYAPRASIKYDTSKLGTNLASSGASDVYYLSVADNKALIMKFEDTANALRESVVQVSTSYSLADIGLGYLAATEKSATNQIYSFAINNSVLN